MDSTDFKHAVETLISVDFVKKYHQSSDTSYALEIETGKFGNRSQVVYINADDDDVIVHSLIGECPDDIEALRALLSDSRRFRYSRICLIENKLYQFFRYPFEELEPVEFGMAAWEVASAADDLERRYFGGADKT